MNRPIRLLNLYPDQLNLNGDLANTLVLESNLRALGFDTVTQKHEVGDKLSIERPDFVMLGHGSNAAWRYVGQDLLKIAPTLRQWVADGVVGLAIGSGNEACYSGDSWNAVPRLGIFESASGTLREVERISKFLLVPVDRSFVNEPVLGYINAATDAHVLQLEKNWIGSQLHGPLLAKNPAVLSWIVERVSGEIDSGFKPIQAEVDPTLSKILTQIWDLETNLASE